MKNQLYSRLLQLERGLDRLILSVCAAGIGLVTVLIAIQVFFRYFLGSSLSWSEEVARYLEVWIVYLGSAYAFGNGQHISMDLLNHFLPPRLQIVLSKINCILCVFFALFCAYFSIRFMIIERSQFMASLRLPKNVAYAALTAGMILMIFYSLILLLMPGTEPEKKGDSET